MKDFSVELGVYWSNRFKERIEKKLGQVKTDFVVKETDNNFNQITDDQATEHMNRKSKVERGLVGILQEESAHTKWCLICNDKAQLAEDTNALLGAGHTGDVNEEHDEDNRHKDMLRSRMKTLLVPQK